MLEVMGQVILEEWVIWTEGEKGNGAEIKKGVLEEDLMKA